MVTDRTETSTDLALEVEETGTPKEELKFDQAHVDDQVRQARNAALADVGRLTKESERAVKAATAAGERIKKMLKEQDEADLESAKGDSELRSTQEVKERIRRRQVQDELEEATLKLTQSNEELSQIKEDSAEATKGTKAREIATRLGIDADRLIKLSKFTDGTAEAMEELARELPKKQEVRPPTITDSGADSGGGAGSFTLGEINNMSDDEYAKNQGAIEKARMAGKIKR